MEPISFDEQAVIVTGAGNGLGKVYALELARRGAKVVVNDLGTAPDGTGQSAAADAVVAEITAAGGEAVASTHSVATAEGGEGIVQTALDAFGRVDALISNAGILRDKSFVKLEKADRDAVLDVHLLGGFNVAQPAYKVMRERGYGRILFATSASGLFGNFGQANYAAAKCGLVGLSNVIAIEGAKAGITSNVIAPIARTRLTEELLGPLTELLDPEYVTPLALYLVSKACTVTHEAYVAGAGWYARAFVGLTPGWMGERGAAPSLEDVAGHIGEIRAEDGYAVPLSADQSAAPLAKLLG